MKFQVFLSCGQNPLLDQLFTQTVVGKLSSSTETPLFEPLDKLKDYRWTKEQWRNDTFLLCEFMVDNLDMLFLSQAIAFLVCLALVIAAIPAMKRFEWMSTAEAQNKLKDQFAVHFGRPARAKRVLYEW
jgi:hypothetical protein